MTSDSELGVLGLLVAAEALAEMLAEPTGLSVRLPLALRHMLAAVGGDAGTLLVGSPSASGLEQHAAGPVPAAWAADLAAGGALQQAVLALLAGQAGPSTAALLGDVTPVSLVTHDQCHAVLLLPGRQWPSTKIDQLVYLGGAVARALAASDTPTSADAWQKLAELHKIAGALTSSVHLDQVLAATVDGIRTILDVEAVALVLQDPDQGDLIFKKTLTNDTDWIVQQRRWLGDSLIGTCLATGQPVLANDAAADARFDASLDGVPGMTVRSVLCMPLVQEGHTLGVVQVCNKRYGAFASLDLDLLTSMAVLVANALHNAQLFHRLTVANAALEASRWDVLRSRSTLQALFDGITSPIYIVDSDFRLVAANRTCAELTGSADYALLGQHCYEALRGLPVPNATGQIADTLHTGLRRFRTERHWPAPDTEAGPEPTEWEITSYPICDEQQRVAQVIVFAQDVTDKARLEASLAQSAKLAAVGQLAAGVAHEINNPLTAIIANTQLLQREFEVGDDRREALDLIALAGERAQRVVRGLLDSARRDHYEPQAIDICGSIKDALSLLAPELRARAVRVVTSLPDDLPPVQGSPDLLQGVWLNLFLNARDALADGGDEIRVDASRHGTEIHVTVADNGGGIAPNNLTRIFEPFYTTKHPGQGTSQGTGLGLAVVQRVVKQHGGRIQVESSAGRGAAFTVFIPVQPL